MRMYTITQTYICNNMIKSCVLYFKVEKSKLFGQVITRGPSVSTQGTFDSCSLFFDSKTKGKLLAIACSYTIMQDLGGIKWCSLMNTKSTSFPWSCCCTAKGWHSITIPSARNSLTSGDVTTRSWTLQLPCAHTAALSACVSHIGFTHPTFPELFSWVLTSISRLFPKLHTNRHV